VPRALFPDRLGWARSPRHAFVPLRGDLTGAKMARRHGDRFMFGVWFWPLSKSRTRNVACVQAFPTRLFLIRTARAGTGAMSAGSRSFGSNGVAQGKVLCSSSLTRATIPSHWLPASAVTSGVKGAVLSHRNPGGIPFGARCDDNNARVTPGVIGNSATQTMIVSSAPTRVGAATQPKAAQVPGRCHEGIDASLARVLTIAITISTFAPA
jgi:hypothetical protein